MNDFGIKVFKGYKEVFGDKIDLVLIWIYQVLLVNIGIYYFGLYGGVIALSIMFSVLVLVFMDYSMKKKFIYLLFFIILDLIIILSYYLNIEFSKHINYYINNIEETGLRENFKNIFNSFKGFSDKFKGNQLSSLLIFISAIFLVFHQTLYFTLKFIGEESFIRKVFKNIYK